MPTDDKVHVIARTMFRSPADGGTITIVDIQDDAGNLLGSARGVDSPTKIAGMALTQMEARLASARVEIAACGLLVDDVRETFSKAELAEYEQLHDRMIGSPRSEGDVRTIIQALIRQI